MAELVENQRLGQVVVRAFLQRLHGRGDRRVAGHHDHFDRLVLLLHFAEQLEATHVRHADVGDERVEELGLEDSQRLGGRGGRRNLVAPLAERFFQQHEDGAFVVDDQDLCGVHVSIDSSMLRCQTDKQS